jgi:hypothetical protein
MDSPCNVSVTETASRDAEILSNHMLKWLREGSSIYDVKCLFSDLWDHSHYTQSKDSGCIWAFFI